jgi:hypothetical protein
LDPGHGWSSKTRKIRYCSGEIAGELREKGPAAKRRNLTRMKITPAGQRTNWSFVSPFLQFKIICCGGLSLYGHIAPQGCRKHYSLEVDWK